MTTIVIGGRYLSCALPFLAAQVGQFEIVGTYDVRTCPLEEDCIITGTNGKDRSITQSSALAPLRLPVKVSGNCVTKTGLTDSVSSSTRESDRALLESGETRCVSGSGSATSGKTLYREDGTRRKRVLLPSVFSSEKVWRLETGDRSQYAESISGEGNFCH